MTLVEICVETAQGLAAAKAGGADRVELCASLDLGGLTPSAGLMRLAAESGVVARALVRPRSGSFLYDADEIRLIKSDIAAAREFGLAGVAIGAARPDGRLDRDLMLRLTDRCGAMGKTLHRVFDLTPDPFEALELAIEIGFDRILTSGQAASAADGAPLIAQLVRAARGRITLIAAAGVTADNAEAILRETRVRELHASCRNPMEAAGESRFEAFGFGPPPRPTDAQAAARLVEAARRFEADLRDGRNP
jgi:copper homeostasis protein